MPTGCRLSDRTLQGTNIRPGFAKGLWLGMANAALDTYLFMGRAPWTFITMPTTRP